MMKTNYDSPKGPITHVSHCLCCGQELDAVVQERFNKPQDMVLVTCRTTDCALQGYTLSGDPEKYTLANLTERGYFHKRVSKAGA